MLFPDFVSMAGEFAGCGQCWGAGWCTSAGHVHVTVRSFGGYDLTIHAHNTSDANHAEVSKFQTTLVCPWPKGVSQ